MMVSTRVSYHSRTVPVNEIEESAATPVLLLTKSVDVFLASCMFNCHFLGSGSSNSQKSQFQNSKRIEMFSDDFLVCWHTVPEILQSNLEIFRHTQIDFCRTKKKDNFLLLEFSNFEN